MVTLPLPAGIGIANIPNQYQKRAFERGIDYNIIVVGSCGLGKSTFVNTLLSFNASNLNKIHLEPPAIQPEHEQNERDKHLTKELPPTTKIVERYAVWIVLNEMEFSTRVCIIDTPGFGDGIDNSACWQPIVDYIDRQFQQHYQNECSSERNLRLRDSRVHACLYFISPNGFGLKPLDIAALKEISCRCNVIPVIGKSDLLSSNEIALLKGNIKETFKAQEIEPFNLVVLDEDDEMAARTKEILNAFPLSVIGANVHNSGDNFDKSQLTTPSSNNDAGNNSNKIYRQLAYGCIDLENESLCDFKKLRSLLFRINMIDLISSTDVFHYQNYRRLSIQSQISQLQQQHKSSRNEYGRTDAQSSESESQNPNKVAESVRKELEDYAIKEERRLRDYENTVRELKERLEKEIEREHYEVKSLQEKLLSYKN